MRKINQGLLHARKGFISFPTIRSIGYFSKNCVAYFILQDIYNSQYATANKLKKKYVFRGYFICPNIENLLKSIHRRKSQIFIDKYAKTEKFLNSVLQVSGSFSLKMPY